MNLGLKAVIIRISLLLLFFLSIQAKATNVSLYQSFAGNLSFVVAGGTLRTADDATNACAVTTGPVSSTISGIPSGSTIQAAYLYWAGSGTTVDSAVTFNGSNITADRTFTEQFNNAGTLFDFFGGFKNVTSSVTGNGTYTFSNLTVNTGTPWCASSGVLSGWSLVVIYSNPLEDFRVVNVFDGLQQFRGSSITLHPGNFQIPASPVNGKFSIISWEGDVGNSATLNGFDENVSFNGTSLTDSANPLSNQFNSTINTISTANDKYGVDIDTYNINSYLTPGETAATTLYSSGGDLVLLTAEVIAVTNTPVSDLAITKTHTGNFAVNSNGIYTIGVSNNGPSASTGTITVTDTLPTGVSFVSATGTGWSCSHVAQDVTCTRSDTLAVGASTPNITLTVLVANSVYPSFTNTATVSGPNFDNISANNTASDTTTVTGVDLSSSTKTVSDLNSGEANIGDILRYTITVNNSTATSATEVSVTDDIPANTSGFTVVSKPASSTDASTGIGTGANGKGFLSISNITVPASSSVTIVFDVAVASGTTPGTAINNSATVTTPVGTGANPSASTIIVSPSQIPTTGTKNLYLDGATTLTRLVSTSATVNTINNAANVLFTMSPATQTAMTLGAGTISIPLRLARNATTGTRNVQVTLDTIGGTVTTLGTQTQTALTLNTTYSTVTFTITLAANVTLAVGTQIRLRVANTTGSARPVLLKRLDGGVNSRVILNSNTVINVNSVTAYGAAYPSVTIPALWGQGETVYIRSVVSDPFGSFDITSANITIRRPDGTALVSAAAMTQVADSGTSTKTYEYAYVVPTSPLGGYWNVTVNAKEGTENTISDSMVGTFYVEQAIPTLTKISSVYSDPERGISNPKRIPGAVIQYTIQVSNTGKSSPDANAIFILDPIDTTKLMMCVSTLCSGAATPMTFTNSTPSSALSFTYSSHVTYSNQVGGGAPFTYTPVPDANGYDSAVTGFRVAPAGTMAASSGASPYPGFSLSFRAKIK